ncbi:MULTISPECIES: hypothetical protein [Halomonas]|uniref:Uncharacterized protein n=1 Tax=Halomonas colorata TaxID=2742615 RepID=A0ABR9FXT7_9GAMM|nr:MULTISPECIES: hypothetical protein [Halomonas]MBE0463461.1 hypothetical protein [Halomonas colorata]
MPAHRESSRIVVPILVDKANVVTRTLSALQVSLFSCAHNGKTPAFLLAPVD